MVALWGIMLWMEYTRQPWTNRCQTELVAFLKCMEHHVVDGVAQQPRTNQCQTELAAFLKCMD